MMKRYLIKMAFKTQVKHENHLTMVSDTLNNFDLTNGYGQIRRRQYKLYRKNT